MSKLTLNSTFVALSLLTLFSFSSASTSHAGWFDSAPANAESAPAKPDFSPKVTSEGIFGISGGEVYRSTIIHKSPEMMGGDTYLRYLNFALHAGPTQLKKVDFFKAKANLAKAEEKKKNLSYTADDLYKQQSGMERAEYNQRMMDDPDFAAERNAFSAEMRVKEQKQAENKLDQEYISTNSRRLFAYVRPDQAPLSGPSPAYQEKVEVKVDKIVSKTGAAFYVAKITVSGTDATAAGEAIERVFDASAFIYSPASGVVLGATRDLLFGANEDFHTGADGKVEPGPDGALVGIAKYYAGVGRDLSPEALASAVLKLRSGIDRVACTKFARFRPVLTNKTVSADPLQRRDSAGRVNSIPSSSIKPVTSPEIEEYSADNRCAAYGAGNDYCKVWTKMNLRLVAGAEYAWNENKKTEIREVEGARDEDGDAKMQQARVTFYDVPLHSARKIYSDPEGGKLTNSHAKKTRVNKDSGAPLLFNADAMEQLIEQRSEAWRVGKIPSNNFADYEQGLAANLTISSGNITIKKK